MVVLAVLAVVDLIAVLVIWLLALRSGNQVLKRAAKFVGICGLIVIGMQAFVVYQKNGPRPNFVTDAVGPARGTGGTTSEVLFHAMVAGEVHRMELTPRAEIDEKAQGKIELYFKLTDAQGKVLAEAAQAVDPAEGRMWRPVQFTYTPESVGELRLRLEIPAGVDAVHVVAKDPR